MSIASPYCFNTPKPAFGDVLKNGATVIACEPHRSGEYRIVLARNGKREWVTWALFEREVYEPSTQMFTEDWEQTTEWGHYFNDLLDAVIDFQSLTGRNP